MGVEWNNYETYSYIDANIWLNSKKLFTLLRVKLDHPWLACKADKKSFSEEKTMQIFKVSYPIAGIITIPVSASVGVKYGYDFTIVNTVA